VQTQTIKRGSQTWTQNFGYDTLNRLTSAAETISGSSGWSESYTFDNVGNRWVANPVESTNEIPQASSWYTANGVTNNRVIAWTYDQSGNVLSIPAIERSSTYDAENRQLSVAINGIAASYTYDSDGRRITKAVAGASPTIYVYDPNGQLAAEYGTPTDTDSGTRYLTADALGSTRLVADSTATILNCYDYLPFGQELSASTDARPSCFASSPDGLNLKFTGKERDAESGLDYFGARYFSGAQGRFTSPDEPFNDQYPSDPQSWNLYSYVRNNPLRNVDPSGEDCITATNQTQNSVTATVTSGNCSGNATNQTYVAGTVNMGSLTYNGTSIGFSYTSYDPNTIAGVGTFNLGPAPSDALSASAQQVLGQAGTMASDGSVFRGGALWIGQFLAMLDGAGGPGEEFEPAEPASTGGKLRFGNNPNQEYHTFRHVEEAGISKQAAETAIRNDLAGKEASLSQGLTKGQVNVGGKTLEYNAFKLPDGTINVGRITVH